jgi:Flp pilus assembly protein TadB
VDRVGVWALKNVPGGAWGQVPRKDLAVLQISETRFYGEKVLWSALGLVLVPALSTFFTVLGLPIPVVVPTGGSLLLAGVGWFVPNYNAVDDAKRARVEFLRALGAYIELVALERRSGASGQQALATAAAVGDSWVFKRIAVELRRARYASRAPWESLHALSEELGVPELDDLADIMQQSGQDGAQIYANLRARAAALRSAMLSAEIGKANAASERMYIPASLLGVVFMAILITPALLRFTT